MGKKLIKKQQEMIKDGLRDNMKKKEVKNIYVIWLECSNCGERSNFKFKRGERYESQTCHNCGCETLHRIN